MLNTETNLIWFCYFFAISRRVRTVIINNPVLHKEWSRMHFIKSLGTYFFQLQSSRKNIDNCACGESQWNVFAWHYWRRGKMKISTLNFTADFFSKCLVLKFHDCFNAVGSPSRWHLEVRCLECFSSNWISVSSSTWHCHRF